MCWWCRGNIFKAMIFFTKKKQKKVLRGEDGRELLIRRFKAFLEILLLTEPCLCDDIGLSPFYPTTCRKRAEKSSGKRKRTKYQAMYKPPAPRLWAYTGSCGTTIPTPETIANIEKNSVAKIFLFIFIRVLSAHEENGYEL